MSAGQNGIWVSELNSRSEVRKHFPPGRAVQFYDTTLRDGEQSVGVVLTPQQKLEIARGLDSLGVGRIEAGFPRVSAEDAEAFGLIAKAGLSGSPRLGRNASGNATTTLPMCLPCAINRNAESTRHAGNERNGSGQSAPFSTSPEISSSICRVNVSPPEKTASIATT